MMTVVFGSLISILCAIFVIFILPYINKKRNKKELLWNIQIDLK
jgi:hypothetical protein